MIVRRPFAFLALAACTLAACGSPSPPAKQQALLDQLNTAITHAVAFLESQQSPDGAYRSRTYGFMRDGPTLTPHVLSALVVLPESMTADATQHGVDYLLTLDPQTTTLLQPVYTAAATSWVLRFAGHETAADPWLDLIESHQLTNQLGWPRTDPRYGGWSYATSPPVYNPDAIDPTRPDANISATLYGVGALHLAGRLNDAQAASTVDFVKLVLGHFSPTDPARNKAGPLQWRMPEPAPCLAAPDRRHDTGEMLDTPYLYAEPYGSAMADGVRVLLACRVASDDDLVQVAGAWLTDAFRPDTVPGEFAPDREPLRHGYYHYYAWSVSHALRRLGVTHAGADRSTPWAEQLAIALIDSQDDDGAWRNPSTDGKEDDPLVATPFAVSALAVCRNALMEMPTE